MANLLSTALLALLILVACSETVSTSIITPTETPLPEATAPSDSQPVLTQPANPTQEPTPVATPPPTETPTTAPETTVTAAPAPTLIPEPTPSANPAPTPPATATPTPTQMNTATPPPSATAAPNPTPTPIPTATPSPTATSTPAPTQPPAQPSNLWRGITIAPENRCSPYDSDEYRYSPSVEPRIVAAQGGIYGPYTGTWFESIKETDIEHIVARSEAHDSGLCAAGPATWSEFASDLLNLTLASPSVNRHQKSDNDAAEWLPELNQCWYSTGPRPPPRRPSKSAANTGSPSTAPRRRRLTESWQVVSQLTWSCWRPEPRQPPLPLRPQLLRQPRRIAPTLTPWPCGMTTGTAASRARRPVPTA